MKHDNIQLEKEDLCIDALYPERLNFLEFIHSHNMIVFLINLPLFQSKSTYDVLGE